MKTKRQKYHFKTIVSGWHVTITGLKITKWVTEGFQGEVVMVFNKQEIKLKTKQNKKTKKKKTPLYTWIKKRDLSAKIHFQQLHSFLPELSGQS